MKFEPLSHCPYQTDAAVLRANFGTRTRASAIDGSVGIKGSSAAAAPGFLARMRNALARFFRRDRHAADEHDHACHCDVEARLLELETRKLDTQMLGHLRD
jgi:hypothetical protein